jgi:hypothetical protein
MDVALRTAVASLVSVPLVSWGLMADAQEELALHELYRQLARQADPKRSFPLPSRKARVQAQHPGRLAFRAPDGLVELLRFQSPYEAIHPEMRERYSHFGRNSTAWAQHWRHHDGPRPTLCVIHGFMASPYWLNSAFFSLPWFYRQGYDVLLFVMPFHGLRQPLYAPFSGWGLFAHGLAHVNESIAHAVHDFRLFVDYLQRRGVQQMQLLAYHSADI